MLPFASIANHANLRCDAKYRLFWGITGDSLYPQSKVPCYPIRLATVPQRIRKLKKGGLDSEYELVELEDVEKRTGAIVSSTEVTELQSDKLLFGDADVLTTRLRPYLGKTIRNDRSRPLAGTTEWIPIKLNPDRLHPTLLLHYLLSPRYVDNAERLLSGKEHPRIAESDILALRVPFFERRTQEQLVRQIEKHEKDIARARAGVKDEQEIINEVLCCELQYPLAEHLERERARHFVKPFDALAAGFTLRNSSRYHHPDFEIIEQFFSEVSYVRVKRYLAVPIRLGATAKKGDFVEEGDAYYVHPGATKTQGVIQLEDCHQVTDVYYEQHQRRVGLRPGDVIINRSGEAHGKVAVFDSDAPAVASDFTMRVRVNEDANPRFLWYFFRSVIFQAQIAREVRGASVPNIFPPQVEQMLVVECSRTRQDALVEQVDAELNKLRTARERMVTKHQEILALIDVAANSAV
jgi:restriction endonuclease S subunit